jgi:hypothetical protein
VTSGPYFLVDLTLAVAAGADVCVSLAIGRTYNFLFGFRGLYFPTRKTEPDYFWGNVALAAIVFAGFGYWAVRLTNSN